MKNINKIKEVIIWLALIAPFIYAFMVWNHVPDQIPSHYNIRGEVDGYSGKASALLLLPVMNFLIYFVLYFIPRIDPRYKNYRLFGSSYQNIRLLIHIFFFGIFIYTTEVAIRGNNLSNNILFAGIMIFFALLGNYLRTVRSNFFVGIRTPWTLSNDEVWRKTHELGGKIWFYCGLAGAIILLFLPEMAAVIVMGSMMFVMILIPVVYSYFLYRRIMGAPSQE